MRIRKYKYYFRKPKSEIAKDILFWLVVAGAITVAATSPYFVINLWKGYRRWQKYPKKKFSSTFSRLKKQGCVKIEKRNHEFFISLTEKGKKKAGRFQIDSLEIKRPKKWDRKWRIVIFDISQLRKFFRELFRRKLKDLGFLPLQKSVWIHAFDCHAEIEALKEFFALNDKEVRLIVAENIGSDEKFKKIFGLK